MTAAPEILHPRPPRRRERWREIRRAEIAGGYVLPALKESSVSRSAPAAPSRSRVYIGTRHDNGQTSVVALEPDGESRPIAAPRRFTREGFDWGADGGSGATDLAFVLARDALGREPHPREFMGLQRVLVSELGGEAWEVAEPVLRAALQRLDEGEPV